MVQQIFWDPFSGEGPPLFKAVSHDEEFGEKTNGEPDKSETSSTTVAASCSKKPHANPWYRQNFGDFQVTEKPMYQCDRKLRVVCTGAGATALQVAYKFGKLMEDVDLVLYEKNDAVGGTWLENRYPGCACDIPSHTYQFSWNRNPNWSSFYSPAAEILKYLQDTADKFDLHRFVKLKHRVCQANWNDDSGKWVFKVQRPDGSTFTDEADIFLNTSGALNVWKYPNIPGLQTFKGNLMHTASWDTTVDLRDKVVAVIGSGSSAIQVVPGVAPYVKKLFNFVRSPVWLSPGFAAKYAGPEGSNFQYTEEQKELFRKDQAAYIDYIRNIEEDLGSRFRQQHEDSEIQLAVRDAMAARMRAKLGKDEIAEYLIPNFGLGCRRLSPGDEYMACFTRDNVEMIRSGVTRVTEDGVVDDKGKNYAVDIIVCATGFDTSFTPSFPIVGRNGVDLKSFYGHFPRGYLSIMTPQFPNFYQFTGPGAPGSHGPFFSIIEWMTRYMMKTLQKMQRENIKALEPTAAASRDYYNWCHTMFKRLVYSQPCASWYKNGNHNGPVTAQYPGSRLHWYELLREPRYEDFRITYITNNKFQFLGNGFTQNDVDQTNLTWFMDAPEI
ncbi:uncharacterized protein Z519_02872 [Cladophialophora bantiana CBS 173.52]|uniref:Sterigmatocystin biosynthesis monooxygenase stcW n=1 Tax=Cladophialophora bantiana (strain ATCC 10958 / CBS 173.52 / CDC B-1940 / NIH 8579) TaxID=1442370 RepID=A0A0D2HQT2_CLAB1|nr:uncharacterized protein Z519_02872 [Cladophialophora bantiana CBS 173.52]KIW95808.1 hypothetical protein Z519_02872 [Cladophialophora bantiana CBS 173.52]